MIKIKDSLGLLLHVSDVFASSFTEETFPL